MEVTTEQNETNPLPVRGLANYNVSGTEKMEAATPLSSVSTFEWNVNAIIRVTQSLFGQYSTVNEFSFTYFCHTTAIVEAANKKQKKPP